MTCVLARDGLILELTDEYMFERAKYVVESHF